MIAETRTCDVAVIGAGPAGLAAAVTAAQSGASVVCIDLFATTGGQYSMQPSQAKSPFIDSAQARKGQQAEKTARAAGAEFIADAEVFWANRCNAGGFVLSVNQGGKALLIQASALVAASGAMERPLPFQGWTLPGVIGAGAAQRLLKTGTGHLPVPGKVILAGTGPFLLAVGQTFHKAGQAIDHFVEMRRLRVLASARLLLTHPSKITEAISLLVDIHRSGAQRHMGYIVTRAIGDGKLEAVEIAPLDRSGLPDLSRARTVDGVGTLAIGYGFQPVIDLTAALGADHAFDMSLGGWHCLANADGESAVPGLFVAGETLGIGGSIPARLSGQIAGAMAAKSAGYAATDLKAPRAALASARHFAAGLSAIYPPPQTLPLALPEGELICRCEDVSAGDIAAAVADGARETVAIKMWTRAGMGPCQGRICGAGLHAVMTRAGVSSAQAAFNRPHLPLRPTPIRVVRAAMAELDRCQEEGS